jgi:hypothetical protein
MFISEGYQFRFFLAKEFINFFSCVDLSKGTNFGFTWYENELTTFPAIDMSSGTYFLRAWSINGVMTSFETRDFYKINEGSNCFLSTTLPTADWSDILITQEANNINNNVTLHGGSSTYNTAGGVARALLVARGWIIADGGAE